MLHQLSRSLWPAALVGFFAVSAGAAEVRLPACDFSRLLHGISKVKNTTTLRKEVKVVVPDTSATTFLNQVEGILKKRTRPGVAPRTIALRDEPKDPTTKFVTNTDYFPVFRGVGAKNERIFSGVIRIRNYRIAPRKTKPVAFDQAGPSAFPLVRLADGEDELARLEFKVGHPGMDLNGLFQDVDGVVDKPGVLMKRADINTLFRSQASFDKNRGEIEARTEALLRTDSAGKSRRVNNAAEVSALLDRIGEMHRSGLTEHIDSPAVNVRYVRTARKIVFTSPLARPGDPPTFEVQITMDKDVRMKDYATGMISSFPPSDRVIELKIPTDYADLSDAELDNLGLSDLSALRRTYEALSPAPDTRRNSGKRAQLSRVAARALSAEPRPAPAAPGS